MRQLHEMTSSSFLLMRSSALMGQVQARLDGLDQLTHLIIWHKEKNISTYFLCDRRDLWRLTKAADHEDSLFQALGLDHIQPTATVDTHIDARLVPDRCIVLEDDWVVGFFDAHHPSDPKRGPGRMRQEICLSLVTEFPSKMAVRETVSLLVALSLDSDFGEALQRKLPLGTTIDIVVQTIEGFEPDTITKNLVVSDPPALPLQFRLRTVKDGSARLRLLVFYHGEGIGEVVLASTIISERFVGSSASKRYQERLSPFPEAQPELSLWVFEKRDLGGELVLDFRLSAANANFDLNMSRFGEVSLGNNFQKYVKQIFDSIDQLSLVDEHSRERAERELETQGAGLFERVMPKRLRAELLKLRPRIRYFQIQSEEPWIPWELCRLWGRGADGRIEEPGFLCDRFAVTRWRPGFGQKPALSLRNLALIVPESDLPMAQSEKEFIQSLANRECTVCEITPSMKGVERALISGTHDAIHFTGHGSYWDALDREAIRLGDDDLVPEHITGLVANLGEAAPLVFLNACSTGRTYRRLNEIEGWAQRFMSAGCAAFIGTYWQTRDDSCLTFTREFYRRLLSGNKISEAVREARRSTRAQSKGDPTWLAYTIYAHPLAVLE